MIIWSGFGFLVAAFVIASSVLCNLLFDAGFGAGYYAAHHWTIGVSMLLAAGLSAAAAWGLRHRGARVLLDEASGQRVVLRSRDTLFFVPVRFWAIGLGAIGAVLLASEALR